MTHTHPFINIVDARINFTLKFHSFIFSLHFMKTPEIIFEGNLSGFGLLRPM